jgi:hypothetical protein
VKALDGVAVSGAPPQADTHVAKSQ